MKVQGTAVSLTVQIFMGLCSVCRKKNLSSACFHLLMETISVTHIKKKKIKSTHTSLVFHRYFQVFHCF